jgi:nucleotide-binding universal stress UspA family protein
MYKHILVPVDLADPEASDPAFGVARHIAQRDGARISVLSVVPAWPGDLDLSPRDHQPELDALIKEVAEGTAMTGEVQIGGSISGRIIQAILNKGIDLVVMASHNPKITDYLIGSNAAHVVLHSSCSVLVVRNAPSRFQKLLVPVDLDYPETSAKAMEVAKAMARAEGSKLTVVSVQPLIMDETGTPPPDYRPKMDAFLARHGGDIESILAMGGSVTGEIRVAAEQAGADLIVMGSHDPHFTDYLIGSNAAHVALHTPVSVLVVR